MSKIIVLDPGHGLDRSGKYQRPLIDCRDGKTAKIINKFFPDQLDNISLVYREDFGTLKIALKTKEFLESSGHIVYLTRGDNNNAEKWIPNNYTSIIPNITQWKKDFWQSWRWTQELCKAVKSDMFISIHTNASGGQGGKGCCGFWHEKVPGEQLCKDICEEITRLGIKKRKIDKHSYLILREHSRGRTCLIECLFHDYYDDVKLILDDEGINKMARAISNGIVKNSQTF